MVMRSRSTDELCEIAKAAVEWGQDRNLERSFRIQLLLKAEKSAALAVQYAPSDYLPWLWLARAQTRLGRWDAEDICLRRARALVIHREQVKMFPPPEDEEE